MLYRVYLCGTGLLALFSVSILGTVLHAFDESFILEPVIVSSYF